MLVHLLVISEVARAVQLVDVNFVSLSQRQHVLHQLKGIERVLAVKQRAQKVEGGDAEAYCVILHVHAQVSGCISRAMAGRLRDVVFVELGGDVQDAVRPVYLSGAHEHRRVVLCGLQALWSLVFRAVLVIVAACKSLASASSWRGSPRALQLLLLLSCCLAALGPLAGPCAPWHRQRSRLSCLVLLAVSLALRIGKVEGAAVGPSEVRMSRASRLLLLEERPPFAAVSSLLPALRKLRIVVIGAGASLRIDLLVVHIKLSKSYKV